MIHIFHMGLEHMVENPSDFLIAIHVESFRAGEIAP